MSVRSMTGFARVKARSEAGEVTVTAVSLNHRGLDLHFRLGPELSIYENTLRNLAKEKIGRGHLQIRIWFEPARPVRLGLNQALLEAYLTAFRELSERYGLAGEPDLNQLLALPGILREPEPEVDPGVEALLVEGVRQALEQLNLSRVREGEALAEEMRSRLRAIVSALGRLEEARKDLLPRLEKRLRERLAELLAGAPIEQQRIVQEAAILADRCDVTEETTRLRVHVEEALRLLAEGGEVGKKLDFLLQEMRREAGTLLAKAGNMGELGLPLTGVGVEIEAEIEKLREQVLNIE